MEVKYEWSCGIDTHKKNVVACAVVPGADGQPEKETRSYGTLRDELGELRTWLK